MLPSGQSARKAPDGSPDVQDWRFLVGLFCFASFIDIAAWGHLQAFTPLFLAQELKMDAASIPFWTGILAALPLALAVPLSPLWGVIADRHSMKLVIMRSLCLESVAYVGAALADNLGAFVAARLLVGLAFGNNAVIVAVISLVTPERRLGTAVGLYTTIFPIGLSVGPLLGSALIALVGLRWMYAIDAALCVGAAVVLAIFMREPSRVGRRQSSGWRAHLGSVFGIVLRHPVVRWNFALWFLISGGIALLDPYIPVLVASVYQGPALAATIGVVLAVFGVASGVATPFTPRLADRLGAARALALAAAGLAVVALALPLATTVPMVAVLLLVRAAPQATTVTTLFTHLARHTPAEHRAGVMALSPLPRNLAMFLAPLAGSALSSLGLGAVFVLAGLLFLISVVATVPLQRAERQRALGAGSTAMSAP